MSLIRSFINFLYRLFGFEVDPVTRSFQPKVVSEIPEKLDNGIIYIEKSYGNCWEADFMCPYGCGETIQLNLMEDINPSWRIYYDKDERISLSPSIHMKKPCGCHYLIKNGQLIDATMEDRFSF